MFGLLISGRPISAQPEQVSPTQLLFRIPSVPSFSYLGVFLLPGQELPPDAGALVYIQIPPSQDFKLLGALANSKQSAIFRINNASKTTAAGNGLGDVDAMVDEDTSASATAQAPEIVVGISLEPAANVEAQLATLKANSGALVKTQPGQQAGQGSATASPVTTKVLAQRIIGNAFNFLASFGSDTVPLKAFQDWWTKFEKKVELDPGFLEREQG